MQPVNLPKIPAISRYERLVINYGYRGNPQIIVTDVPVARPWRQSSDHPRVMRNDWDGIEQMHPEKTKILDFTRLMASQSCAMPELPEHSPRKPDRLRGVFGCMRCGPRLPTPKTNEMGCVTIRSMDRTSQTNATLPQSP